MTEAAKPVEKPLAAVAYVYSAFDTVHLGYLGQYLYEFKQGHVTRIDSLPEHKEIDQNRSMGNNLAWTVIPLKGEFIARQIIDNRGKNKMGLVVFTEEDRANGTQLDGVFVPDAVIKQAQESASAYMLQAIEEFVISREKAKAGVPGNKMRPDTRVYDWMKKFRADDEMFAEQHAKTDSTKMLALAVEKIAEMAKALQGNATVAVADIPVRGKDEAPENYSKRMIEWASKVKSKSSAA